MLFCAMPRIARAGKLCKFFVNHAFMLWKNAKPCKEMVYTIKDGNDKQPMDSMKYGDLNITLGSSTLLSELCTGKELL